MELSKLVRENILRLKPYSCARDEYSGGDAVFLDANENPYPNGCNRYPDPRHTALKQRIAALKGVTPDRIILGNGSDEVIDLLIRSTCRPGVDNIIVFSPGYSMYEVSAAVNDAEVRKINLRPDFQPDVEALENIADANTKLVFVCTPNNPTGNIIPHDTIVRICRMCPESLIVADEAYIDFADSPSATALLGNEPNLFILQTLSKSWGMAGLRIGIGIGPAGLIAVLDRVKAPYNISGLSQGKALELLAGEAEYERKMAEIKQERERVYAGLTASGIFSEIYPSQANFILAVTDDCRELYDFLAGNGVVVRMRDIPPLIAGGVRISIGTPAENDRLLELLEQWKALQN